MAAVGEIDAETAGGQEGVDLLKKADKEPTSKVSTDPAALYGLIGFVLALVVLVIGLFTGAATSFLVLVVMLAQLYLVRKAVFSPATALKLLKR